MPGMKIRNRPTGQWALKILKQHRIEKRYGWIEPISVCRPVPELQVQSSQILQTSKGPPFQQIALGNMEML